MFDSVAHVVLPVRDATRDLRLYREHLGFEERGRWAVDEYSTLHDLWRLPPGALQVIELAKPAAAGGSLLLVEHAGLPAPAPRSMAVPGPFSLDLYVRDLPALVDELAADGFAFLSDPVRYQLFGADFEVDEVILRAPSGLVHALVEWIPDRHRCILSNRPDQRVSEIVAVVTLIDDIDAGLTTMRDVLGGSVYLDTAFHGPAIERLLSLPEGTAFRAVLLRGEARGNARYELMTTNSGLAPALGEAPESPRGLPAAVPFVRVTALDAALEALGDRNGQVVGPMVLDVGPFVGHRAATLWPRWGGPFGLVGPGTDQ